MTPPRRVIVAGGGIAGIAAALALAERGCGVVLVEASKRLGGRATSFDDVRTGLTLDNCQHVTMGCCEAYLDLLKRLGVQGLLRWTRAQTWIEPGGRRSVIRRDPAPEPAHFARSFAGAHFLSASDKAAVAWGLASMSLGDVSGWEGRTFGEWLDGHAQPPGARRRFWDPVVLSACNLHPGRVAAGLAIKVFRDGLLGPGGASDVGVPSVPLVRLYDPVEPGLWAHGGRVVFGASVVGLTGRSAVLSDGSVLDADAVICALPSERAARVLPSDDPRAVRLEAFEHSPILGVHLRFDRPVLDVPHAVLLDCETQWVFRKDAEGRQVHAVISAAEAWVRTPADAITDRVVADLRMALPDARRGSVVWSRPVLEKRATFAATPEAERLRPGPGVRGEVILAGDYTRTGWPATMEGAARSGYRAAEAALGLPTGAVWRESGVVEPAGALGS